MSGTPALNVNSIIPEFLSGGGEMGQRIREFDWTTTSLGPVQNWPQSLRSALSICLNSNFPIAIYWGKELVLIYNDAWKPIPGNKHPWALGRAAKQVWPEIWDFIGPQFNKAFDGIPGGSKDALLPMQRHGYVEECYFDFTFTPVYGEGGKVEGVFNAVIETTKTILNERQLQTLRGLGNLDRTSKNVDDVLSAAAAVLEKNNKDFPFAIIYKINEEEGQAHSIFNIGIDNDQNFCPSSISLAKATGDTANFYKAYTTNLVVVSENGGRRKNLPTGGWDKEATHFIHVPIINQNSKTPVAILSAALNPYRRFDELYEQFAQLIADQISTEVNNVLLFEEQRKRAEALAEIDQAKTAFFTNISHEFRTPLTLMLGSLEELLKQPEPEVSEANKITVETTHRNALRLLGLVNNLLDFSRIEAGKVNAQFQLTDIAAYTNSLASSFRSVIETAGLQFQVLCNAVTQPVYVDKEMWEKIVLNLLSNAFKYTWQGNIKVLLTTEDNLVLFSVTDTGVGIPPAELPKMFQRFHRVQNVTGRTYEGTGIGLSLVSELVSLHGGNISVQSTQGVGTTFTVAIPTGKEHLNEEQLVQNENFFGSKLSQVFIEEAGSLVVASQFENGEKIREGLPGVLVVDDNHDMRRYISNLLQPNFNVFTAGDGMDALRQLKERQVDLVVSDIMMPVMDGIQLLKTIKQTPQTTNLPVILVSARAGEEAKVEGFDIGADDYLIKPFSAREMVARVTSQISLAKKRDSALQDMYNLFNGVPFAVVVLKGEDLVIDYINQYNLDVWQCKREDVIGKPLFVARPDIRAGTEAVHNAVYKNKKRFVASEVAIELNLHNKKELRYFSTVVDPMFNQQGEMTGQIATAIEITEQVLARKKIEETEVRFRSLAQNSPDIITRHDKDFRYLYASPLIEGFTNIKPEAYIGKSCREVGLPENVCAFYDELLTQMFASKKPRSIEYEKIDVPGTYVYSRLVPEFDPTGEMTSVLVLTTDITERKKVENQTRYFATLMQSIADAVIGTNTAYNITSWNKGAEEMYGFTAAEVMGRPARDFLQTQFISETDKEAWPAALQTKGNWQGEVIQRKKDGGALNVLASIANVKNDKGEVIGAVGVNRNITDRKKIEEDLKSTKEQLEITFRNVPAAIYLFDKAGNILFVNENAARLMGFTTVQEVLNEKNHQVLKNKTAEIFELRNQNNELVDFSDTCASVTLRTGQASEMILQSKDKRTGQIVWLLSKAEPLVDDNGKLKMVLASNTDISSQKLAEAELKRFKHMADNATEPFILMREDGTFAYLNDMALERWGYTREEALNIRVPDVDPIYNNENFNAAFSGAQKGKLPQFETLHKKKNGNVYPVEINMGGLTLEGKPHLFAIARDITERKKIEHDLQNAKEQLELTFKNVPSAIYLFGKHGEIIYINDKGAELMGYQSVEALSAIKDYAVLIKKSADTFEILTENRMPFSPDKFPSVITYQSAKPAEAVFLFVRKSDKKETWAITRSSPLLNDEGELTMVLTTSTDITRQKIAEAVIRESEEKIRSFILQAPVAMCLYRGPQYIVEIVNDELLQIWDKPFEAVINKPVFEAMPLAKGQGFEELLNKVYATGEKFTAFGMPITLTRRGRTETIFVNLVYEAYRDSNGTISGIVEVVNDVTEQVTATKKVKESGERFRVLAETLPQLIWMTNTKGDQEYASSRWKEYTGIEQTGWESWQQILHPDDMPGIAETWADSVAKGRSYKSEVRLKNRVGQYRWHVIQGEPIKNEDGTIMRWIGAFTDVHDQKTLSEKLEKLVSERTKELERSNDDLQQFAHVASHDLKEPVRKVKTFSNRLNVEFEEVLPEKAKTYLKKVERAADRMYEMIDGVLLYSTFNGVEQNMEKVDLNEVFENIETDLEILIQKHQAVIKYNKLPVVTGSPVLLHQLFYNLINNAIKFSKPDVRPLIQVTSHVVKPTNPQSNGLPNIGYTQLRISDNGIGFNQVYGEKIFKTFVRLNSKDRFEGTGLGLALCKKIVERHGGTIEAEGREGEGAVFTITLPIGS